ncbi:Tenascin-R [Exaiptasia diaphana]|nr:Tenascin-R [Exaiptasia diaphana]
MLNEIYGKVKGNGKPSKGGGGKVFKNCKELHKRGFRQSGVYTIDPDGKGRFKVYCDQKTDGGGWTVFQKRQDGSVDFYRGWNAYKNGFGDLKGEFWLGLDKIKRLTHQRRNRLRVDLEDTKGKTAYAEYDYFAVASERAKYKLSLGSYKGREFHSLGPAMAKALSPNVIVRETGTAGDSLSWHRGMPFTTKDRDNDKSSGNCAVVYKGAWWYNECHNSNLNDLYHHVFKNCADLYKHGIKQSGVYSIDPDGKGRFKVYCDQKTDGGGWTVIQKRQDGSVNFYRGWMYYKNGFGDLKGEFWLGLDKINRLTHQRRNRLRVDLEDTKGKTAYAEYDNFAVASERAKYKLSLGTYSALNNIW